MHTLSYVMHNVSLIYIHIIAAFEIQKLSWHLIHCCYFRKPFVPGTNFIILYFLMRRYCDETMHIKQEKLFSLMIKSITLKTNILPYKRAETVFYREKRKKGKYQCIGYLLKQVAFYRVKIECCIWEQFCSPSFFFSHVHTFVQFQNLYI